MAEPNPFDQFDEPAAAANPFDQFDEVPAQQQPASPIDEMSTTERFRAGIGRGLTQAGAGVKELLDKGASAIASTKVGAAVDRAGVALGMPSTREAAEATQQQLQDGKKYDAALLESGAGSAGNFAGIGAGMAPAMLVPGGQTYAGAALSGGLVGAAATPGDMKERAKSGLSGAAFGVGGKFVGTKAADFVRWARARRVAAAAAQQAANATRDATLVAGREAGYVVPPTTTNPSLLNRTLEGIGGKVATAQSASLKNQAVTNALARKALGIPDDVALNVDLLSSIRKEAGRAYGALDELGPINPGPKYQQAIDKLISPYERAARGFPNAKPNPMMADLQGLKTTEVDAGDAVAKIAELRDAADQAFRAGSKRNGKTYREAANALEDAIEEHLKGAGGNKKLLNDYREARQLIAKTYSVEKALNDSTGNVSGGKLAAQLKAGKPLTKELKTAGQFAQAFPKATQNTEAIGSMPNASPLDWAAGGIASAVSGNPTLLAAISGRPALRAVLLSRAYQRTSTAPKYGPGPLASGVSKAIETTLPRKELLPLWAAYGSQQDLLDSSLGQMPSEIPDQDGARNAHDE